MIDLIKDYIYIIAPVLGWFVAQGLKFIASLRKNGISVSDLWQSGGSPSSHTSFVAAPTIIIGLNEGFESAVFAVALILLGVVMYDAMGVRRANGENTKALLQMLKDTKSTYPLHKIRRADGHSPIQVLAGLATGLATGLALYQLL